ncbi:MAG: formimidoylglutamate deiminase [Pyrinomonadaceae bacterium]
MKFKFKAILQRDGWLENATVSTDSIGNITSIEQTDDTTEARGFALPGFFNAHCHSFQYAMAGLTETHPRGGGRDDFWSWRNTMYELALKLEPKEIEVIATMLYAELLRNGYTHVAEFHYLHHDTYGQPYANSAEIGIKLLNAAQRTGINITLIPIFYQNGGFGKPAETVQRRFLCKNVDEYAKLLDETIEACKTFDCANAGVGVHSLRAVETEQIKITAKELHPELPFHIHVAEQIKEIQDCLSFLNKRPVEWLLEELELSQRFNLVHATHINEREICGITDMKANVVLCPTTEANLGDGIFPFQSFAEKDGCWSIGTDSNVSLYPMDELRLLDYGQRLTTNRRDTFAIGQDGNSAQFAIDRCQRAGRSAMGLEFENYFELGKPLNALVFSNDVPLLQNATNNSLQNIMLYALDSTNIEGVITRGKWRTKGSRHLLYDEIRAEFVEVMAKLRLH